MIPAGYIKFINDLKFPDECYVCGSKNEKLYQINGYYDAGVGLWPLGVLYSFKRIPLYLPVCKKHYIKLQSLKYLFWICLLGVFLGSLLGPIIHSLIILIFPLIGVIYILMENKVSIHKIYKNKFVDIFEVVLAIKREGYFNKLSNLEDVQVIEFPKSKFFIIFKKIMVTIILFSPWVWLVTYI